MWAIPNDASVMTITFKMSETKTVLVEHEQPEMTLNVLAGCELLGGRVVSSAFSCIFESWLPSM